MFEKAGPQKFIYIVENPKLERIAAFDGMYL